MAKKVDLQERLNMRFLTVAYKDKQELYGTRFESSDTGNIALDILNLPDSVLEELLELTDPMMELVDFLNKNRNPDQKTLCRMMTASKNSMPNLLIKMAMLWKLQSFSRLTSSPNPLRFTLSHNTPL